MYQTLKEELLRMFYDDVNLVEERVATLSERTKASLRTTRLRPPMRLPGEDVPVLRKTIFDNDNDDATAPLLPQKGLIANRDFEKGEYITTFPMDATTYKDSDGSGKVCYAAGVDMEAISTADKQVEALAANRAFTHLVSAQGVPISMALPTVTQETDGYMGHFAGDGAFLRADTPEQAMRYSTESFKTANAAHVLVADGIFVWTVATKPIAKGEEVRVTHGLEWWKNWLAQGNTKATCGGAGEGESASAE